MRNLHFSRVTVWGIALAAPLVNPRLVHSALVVNEWNLKTSVFDSPTVEQDVDGTSVVQNPFQGQFSASIPPSVVNAAYQISWDASSLSFELDTSLHAHSLSGNVNSFGFIRITPEVDSVLNFDGSLQYNMPIQPARAALAFTVSRTNPNQILFNSSQTRTNFTGPPSGTILLNNSVLLPAGQSWRIQWGLAIDHFDAAIPGAASDGTGHLAFQINPVPEPAALGPLAFASLLIRRSRRR